MAMRLEPDSAHPRPEAPEQGGIPSHPKRLALLFRDSAKDWSEDGAATHAAALSFYTLFSISPLLLVIIGVAGFFYGQDAAAEESLARLESIMGPQAAGAVKTMLDNAGSRSAGIAATAVGLLGVLLGATGVFGHLQGALNRMWRVKPGAGRGILGLLRDRLLSFSLVVFMGLLLIASLAATTVITAMAGTLAAWLPLSSAAIQALNFGISLAATALLFAVLFGFLPDGRVRRRDLWVGAFATALLFSIGRFLIGLYLARGSVSSPYGAAGSLVVLMLWIYYSSQVLFYGAEFTRVFSERFGKGVEPRRGAKRVNGK